MDILYIEHIDQVRGLFLAQLQAAGWNAHGATRPDSARSIIAAHGLPRLIIANLPTYSETAAEVTKAFIGEQVEQCPDLPVIYTVMAREHAPDPLPVTSRVLRKPFTVPKLIEAVAGLIRTREQAVAS